MDELQDTGSAPAAKQPLPNATLVLVLGILSIVFGCCPGFIGLILAIIALVLVRRDNDLYNQHPERYEESTVNNLNAGRITAIIGLVLGAIVTLWVITVLSSEDFWQQYEQAMDKAMEQARKH